MGWFDGKHDGKKVLLGDGALDRTHQYLEELANEYKKGCRRKPTVEELGALLQLVLSTSAEQHLEGFATQRIAQVLLKTEKKKKDQEYQTGDVFAVPFGSVFAFGRIMAIDRNAGTLVEFFRKTSLRMSFTQSILASGRVMHPVVVFADSALRPWRWTVVSSDPRYTRSKEDLKLEFAVADIDEYWTEPFGKHGQRIRDITKADWNRMCAEGAITGIRSHGAIEAQLAKALKLPRPARGPAKGQSQDQHQDQNHDQDQDQEEGIVPVARRCAPGPPSVRLS